MKQLLLNLSTQRRYWAALILIGAALEGGALYYQYVLDEWPCVLCIHVRIWVVAFMLLAMVAIFCTNSIVATRIAHFLNVGIMIGLLERSWRVLAIERGWIFGDCDMDLGMPAWFALDKWFPYLFRSADLLRLYAVNYIRYNDGRVIGCNFSADVDNERGSFHCQLVRLVLLDKAAFVGTFTTIK